MYNVFFTVTVPYTHIGGRHTVDDDGWPPTPEFKKVSIFSKIIRCSYCNNCVNDVNSFVCNCPQHEERSGYTNVRYDEVAHDLDSYLSDDHGDDDHDDRTEYGLQGKAE